MASYNHITLLGNIGRAEAKTFSNGNKIVEASLATTRRYKDRSGNLQEVTQWHNIVIGGNMADNAEKLVTRGSLVLVDGEMTYRNYTGKDGVERTVAEVRVDRFQICSRKEDAAPAEGAQQGEAVQEGEATEDLPF